jgi:hypothetical protein
VVVASCFIGAALLLWWFVRSKIYRGIRSEDDVMLILTDRAWVTEVPGTRVEREWNCFDDVIETENLIVLRLRANGQGLSLPKRLLGPEDLVRVRSLLNEKVGRRRP